MKNVLYNVVTVLGQGHLNIDVNQSIVFWKNNRDAWTNEINPLPPTVPFLYLYSLETTETLDSLSFLECIEMEDHCEMAKYSHITFKSIVVFRTLSNIHEIFAKRSILDAWQGFECAFEWSNLNSLPNSFCQSSFIKKLGRDLLRSR